MRAVPTDAPAKNWQCILQGHKYEHVAGRDAVTNLPVECWACVRCGRIA